MILSILSGLIVVLSPILNYIARYWTVSGEGWRPNEGCAPGPGILHANIHRSTWNLDNRQLDQPFVVSVFVLANTLVSKSIRSVDCSNNENRVHSSAGRSLVDLKVVSASLAELAVLFKPIDSQWLVAGGVALQFGTFATLCLDNAEFFRKPGWYY